MTCMNRNIMFAGGIPADSTEEVYTLLAEAVGDRAVSWPDGENTPARLKWIGGVNKRVMTPAECFEIVDDRDVPKPAVHDEEGRATACASAPERRWICAVVCRTRRTRSSPTRSSPA